MNATTVAGGLTMSMAAQIRLLWARVGALVSAVALLAPSRTVPVGRRPGARVVPCGLGGVTWPRRSGARVGGSSMAARCQRGLAAAGAPSSTTRPCAGATR
jgi:hypothetical protein